MATEEADFVISIQDLVVGFGSQIVLNHLSLDVRRGEISRFGWRIWRGKISSTSRNHRSDSQTARPHRRRRH